MATVKLSNEQKTAYDAWLALPDSEKETLLPVLLDNTAGWRAWSDSSAHIVIWLKTIYEQLGYRLFTRKRTIKVIA